MRVKSLLLIVVSLASSLAFGQGGQPPVTSVVSDKFFGIHSNHATVMPTNSKYAAFRHWDTTWSGGNIDWNGIEQNITTCGTYDFTGVDQALDNGVAQGITVYYFNGGRTAKCAQPSGGDPTSPPVDIDSAPGNGDANGTNAKFKNFVTAFFNHITPSGKHVSDYFLYAEPCNECNQGVSWTGNQKQLVRLYEDVRTIAKAKNSAIQVGSPSCVQPSNASNLAACKTFFNNFFGTASPDGGAGPLGVDFLAWHPYVHLNVCTTPNTTNCTDGWPQSPDIITALGNVQSAITTNGVTNTIIASEGGWGNTAVNKFTDNDMQAGFLAQEYFILITNGLQAFYWYQWDNKSHGTLWYPSGSSTFCTGSTGVADPDGGFDCPAETAYETLHNWVVGKAYTQPVSNSGSVYSVDFTDPNVPGWAGRVVWDESQTCSAGSCTTSNYSLTSGVFAKYTDMKGVVHAITLPATIPIGYKPILIEGISTVLPGAVGSTQSAGAAIAGGGSLSAGAGASSPTPDCDPGPKVVSDYFGIGNNKQATGVSLIPAKRERLFNISPPSDFPAWANIETWGTYPTGSPTFDSSRISSWITYSSTNSVELNWVMTRTPGFIQSNPDAVLPRRQRFVFSSVRHRERSDVRRRYKEQLRLEGLHSLGGRQLCLHGNQPHRMREVVRDLERARRVLEGNQGAARTDAQRRRDHHPRQEPAPVRGQRSSAG
jgi:hypothetical protein